MIEININPFLVTVGSLKIGWGIIMGMVAGIVALPLFVVMASRIGLKKGQIIWLFFLTVVFGYIGALLFAIIEYSIAYHYGGFVINLGIRADGLPIAITILALIYAKISKISFWKLSDVGTPCLILYLAVYRIGCVLVGCCYGLPCNLPWAVVYTNPNSPAPLGTPIYPTQFFHLIWNVLVLVILWIFRKRFKVPGALGLTGWMLYFLGDFPIRFFRGNEPAVLGLSLSELTDLVIIIIAACFLILRLKTSVPQKVIDKRP